MKFGKTPISIESNIFLRLCGYRMDQTRDGLPAASGLIKVGGQDLSLCEQEGGHCGWRKLFRLYDVG